MLYLFGESFLISLGCFAEYKIELEKCLSINNYDDGLYSLVFPLLISAKVLFGKSFFYERTFLQVASLVSKECVFC